MVENYNMSRDVLLLHLPNRINKMAIVSKVKKKTETLFVNGILTVGACSVSWQVRHRAVLSQGTLFQTEIKLKYIVASLSCK